MKLNIGDKFYLGFLWTIVAFGVAILIFGLALAFHPIGKFVKEPRKEYAFLKAEVMYGNLPPNTARVSKCFAEFVGYRANWRGKFYYITGTTGHNPFHPEHIYFSGNERVKIYGERFVPVFRAGSIEDMIEEENYE